MTIARDTAVRIKHTELEGTSIGASINDDGDYMVLVEYEDKEGDTQARFFTEADLVVV
jgi:hypothetical protein